MTTHDPIDRATHVWSKPKRGSLPRRVMGVALLVLMMGAPRDSRAQILETETARFVGRGGFELGMGLELQTSKEGTERAVPFAAEVGLTDRLMLMIEPVFYTAIRPTHGPGATGMGDLEVTASLLAVREGRRSPATGIALETKLPMTEDPLISTGKTDFTGYLIASKRLGRLDLHAHFGYTVFGQPAGAQLNNVWSGAIAGEWALNSKAELFGEVLGTTSSAPEGGSSDSNHAVVPEASGGEMVGSLGFGLHVSPRTMLSFGLSYDNNSAVLIRPGVTVWRR